MRIFFGVLLLSLICSRLSAEEFWNQFRGPHANGTTLTSGLPTELSEDSAEVVWKTPVTGRAWSSPVVWKKQIWVTNAPQIQNPVGLSNKRAISDIEPEPLDKPIRLSAVCLDFETGEVLHDLTLFEVFRPQWTHLTNSYASPTPWIEDGRLYVHFGAYGTACIDTASGRKLWDRSDIECHHWRGPGSSPVVHHDLIYLCFDGYDKQFVMALNKHTGDTVWTRDRDFDYGTDNGDHRKAYCTPRVVNVDGRDLLISPAAVATVAYDADTGETVWTLYHGGMNAAARPLYGNGLVYINAGDGKNALVAVDPKGTGDITETNVRWRLGRMTPKRPSQILIDKHYFMMGDDGVATCVDAVSGKILGNQRVGGNYWASPLYADGRLYAFSQEGKVTVMTADSKLDILATGEFDDGFNASAAVAGKSIILRTFSNVYRVGK